MQKFNYHTHTRRCGHADNNMSDEDFVKEFIKKGFTKIAFTDHCPEKEEIDHRTNMRIKYSEKNEYLESIKSLKEKYKDKIEIETGFEVEYLPGQEENLFELKNETDKLILGQHFIYDDKNDLKVLYGIDAHWREQIELYEKAIEVVNKLIGQNVINKLNFCNENLEI